MCPECNYSEKRFTDRPRVVDALTPITHLQSVSSVSTSDLSPRQIGVLVIELRTRTYLASALTAFSLLAGTVPAGADSIQILSLQTGHSIILDAGGLNRVAVGDGRIAGVVPIGTSQIVVNGKKSARFRVWTSGLRMFE